MIDWEVVFVSRYSRHYSRHSASHSHASVRDRVSRAERHTFSNSSPGATHDYCRPSGLLHAAIGSISDGNDGRKFLRRTCMNTWMDACVHEQKWEERKVVLDMYPCALSDITHYGIGKLRIKIILMIEQQQNKIASFYNIIMVIVLVLLDHSCRKWMCI